MIIKLLNGVGGVALVMAFLLETAQGSHTSEVLTDESQVQSVSSVVEPENNPAEPLAVKLQPQTVFTIPNDILGLPTDIWGNYILNEWLLPEQVLYVSKTFNALAQKISCWRWVAGDHMDISFDPTTCHFKDLFQSQLYTYKFVNLVLDPSLGLQTEHIDQLFDGRLNISFLRLKGSHPVDQEHKPIKSIVIINKFSEVLKTNTTLKSLNLIFFDLENDAAMALKESIAFNNTLQELKLTENRISRKTCQLLKEELGERLSLFVDEDPGF